MLSKLLSASALLELQLLPPQHLHRYNTHTEPQGWHS